MTTEIDKLAGMLESISMMLASFAENHWADWIAEDARRLRSGDLAAIDHFLDAFGGMGSINDLYICPSNGHLIRETEVAVKNEQLSRELSAAWELARILARAR